MFVMASMVVVMIVRLVGALVHALDKDIVELLCHLNLSMLELCQGIDHDCVLEVLPNHMLQNQNIISRELTDALVEGTRHLRIGLSLSIDDLLNIILAFTHVQAELIEITLHELTIREKLLVLH